MRKNTKRDTRQANPIMAWWTSREERRKAAEAEAARKIANEMANSEAAIVDTLLGTRFLHSKLPAEILSRKMDPNQTCCDLEYNARALAREITDQQQPIQVDLRKIDEKLLQLAGLFSESVEQGYKTASYVAMEGLTRGIHMIRARVPQNNLEFASQYVEENARYLASWAELIDRAKGLDLLRENVETQRANYEKSLKAAETERARFRDEWMTDPGKLKMFKMIYDHKTQEERLQWPNEVRDLYSFLLKLRMKQMDLQLQNYLLNQEDQRLTKQKMQVSSFQDALMGQPIVEDPNQLNKFQDAMQEMFQKMAKYDAELDETLKTMDSIEAQLDQMRNAPGQMRAMETVQKQAGILIAQFRREDQALEQKEDQQSFEEMFGLMTPEERQELERENQEQRQQRQNDQDQQLYNT